MRKRMETVQTSTEEDQTVVQSETANATGAMVNVFSLLFSSLLSAVRLGHTRHYGGMVNSCKQFYSIQR